MQLMGFNPTVFVNFFRGLPKFINDYLIFKKQLKSLNNKDFKTITFYPMLGDLYNKSGSMSGQYFHQDLHVAKKIFKNNPMKHVDIGSRTDGFVTHIAVFRAIEIFDVRPQVSKVENILFKQADLMQMPDSLTDYCDSISSLHAIEHFGLGRYGDPLDVDGHLKGLENIYKIVKKGGKFYFSVPIGPQRIEFHGHRIFDVAYLLKQFESKYSIDEFAYVDDNGDLHSNALLSVENIKCNFNCYNGLGIFELTKL